MKKLNRRAFSVLLIAFFITVGLFVYIQRFLEDGESWASYFSRLNSLSEGTVTDRNGVLLAAFTANDNRYNDDRNTRIANYHVTGDFWNRTGTGILTNFSRQLHGYNPVTGMTQTRRISLKLNVDSVLDTKAYAALAGRSYVMPEDVRSLAAPVLAHRLSLSPEARISQKNASEAKALTRLIASLPVPVRAK